MYKGKYTAGNSPENRESMGEESDQILKTQPEAESEAESETQTPKTKKQKKRRVKVGTIAFYGFYVVLMLGLCFMLFGALQALEAWLTRYEASQPKVKCQEVFTQLFETPDWGSLYQMAGISDTRFEGKEQFAAYMEAKVGSEKLTYNETSAGLSGDHKYVVKLGNEKLAAFTLTSEGKAQQEIQEWKLGKLELFYRPVEEVTVQTLPGCKVLVNGKALDDGDMISVTNTVAETYLPEGLHGLRQQTYRVKGLLTKPTVTVLDEGGKEVELTYDAATSTYGQPQPTFTYTEEEAERILGAAEVYCKFMIRAVYQNQLKQYFDENSEVFQTIRKIETWMQSYSGYRLSDGVISDFYRYSDELFSAKVTLTMYVTRWDDSVKEYALDTNFFFSMIDGKWMVTNLTNVDVQKEKTSVRLTYWQDETLLGSEMVASDSTKLTPPKITAPEGMVFTGWFQKQQDEKGNTTYSLVFQPDETVYLPEGTELESMTLYAMFQSAG